jgi:Flp pilus assembly protein TadD
VRWRGPEIDWRQANTLGRAMPEKEVCIEDTGKESTPFLKHPGRRENVFALLILLGAVLAVYLQSTGFSFLDWDDPYTVTGNDHIRHGITAAGLAWLPSGVVALGWHPLTNFSWMVDAQLWGSWAGGFHLTNLLLHAIATLLVWRLFRTLGLPAGIALVGALLYSVHPLRVEPVAWVTGRKDLMVGVWSLAACLAYLHYRSVRTKLAYLAVTATVIGASLSKPLAMVLVPLLVWIDLAWPERMHPDSRHRGVIVQALYRLPEKLPWLLATLLPAYMLWHSHADRGAMLTPFSGSLADRVAYPLLAIGEYLRLSVWPVGLQYLHPMWSNYSASEVTLATVAIIATTVVAWALRTRAPAILLGWGWFLICLAPGAGFVRIGQHAIAERYTYLPSVGLVLAAIAFAWWLGERTRTRKWIPWALAVPCLALTVMAHRYAATWADSMALRKQALAVTREHLDASRWMAITLAANGDREGGRIYADRIARMTSAAGEAEIAFTLGEVYSATGPAEQAAWWLEKATLLAPDQHAVWMSRAMHHLNQKNFAEAAMHFQKVVELRPQFVQAWIGLGYSLIYLNRPDQAEMAFNRAIEINPSMEEAYFHLGVMSEMRANSGAAAAYYRQALERNPWHAAAARRLQRLQGH